MSPKQGRGEASSAERSPLEVTQGDGFNSTALLLKGIAGYSSKLENTEEKTDDSDQELHMFGSGPAANNGSEGGGLFLLVVIT